MLCDSTEHPKHRFYFIKKQAQLSLNYHQISSNKHFISSSVYYQLREEDLRKNLSLRGKYKEIKSLTDKISDFKEKLGDMDVAHLERERRKLKKTLEDFDRDVSYS